MIYILCFIIGGIFGFGIAATLSAVKIEDKCK